MTSVPELKFGKAFPSITLQGVLVLSLYISRDGVIKEIGNSFWLKWQIPTLAACNLLVKKIGREICKHFASRVARLVSWKGAQTKFSYQLISFSNNIELFIKNNESIKLLHNNSYYKAAIRMAPYLLFFSITGPHKLSFFWPP